MRPRGARSLSPDRYVDETEEAVLTTFYIRVTFEQLEPPGLSFRISGMPADWLTWFTPGPLVSVDVGDVFGTGS